ncbi:DUF2746 domain-containing protein [Halobellus sp. Atlit-31R]|nr:DUF2746 domain-containing protein [Halobellus sp. Atlit-31R]
MSFVGRRLNLVLVVALLVLAAGTVGATALYQSGVSAVETQNEQLRAQNEQLREDLQTARDRIQSLQSQVSELQERVETLRSQLSTARDERDAAEADLRSLCDQWRETNRTAPQECENVGTE